MRYEHFFVKGTPIGMPRPRAVSIPLGNGKFSARIHPLTHIGKGKTRKPHPIVGWQWMLDTTIKGMKMFPFDREMGVLLKTFFLIPRPPSHSNKSGDLSKGARFYPLVKYDFDNYLKPVADALVLAGVLPDDCQIIDANFKKRYANDSHPKAGVWVTIEEVT